LFFWKESAQRLALPAAGGLGFISKTEKTQIQNPLILTVRIPPSWCTPCWVAKVAPDS
jgi:hypothetical protein